MWNQNKSYLYLSYATIKSVKQQRIFATALIEKEKNNESGTDRCPRAVAFSGVWPVLEHMRSFLCVGLKAGVI